MMLMLQATKEELQLSRDPVQSNAGPSARELVVVDDTKECGDIE